MKMPKKVKILCLITVAIFASNYTRDSFTAISSSNFPPVEKQAEVRVNSVEIFAWSGPSQKDYIHLKRWKDTTDPNIPHPQRFDLICQLENMSDSSIQDGDYIALVTMDFIFAPTHLHNGDVNKIMNDVSWVRVGFDDLKWEVLPFITKGEKSQIKIKDVSLEGVLKTFNGKEDSIWPWALKATVHILSRDMERVAQGQAIMPMIPSDKRLTIN